MRSQLRLRNAVQLASAAGEISAIIAQPAAAGYQRISCITVRTRGLRVGHRLAVILAFACVSMPSAALRRRR